MFKKFAEKCPVAVTHRCVVSPTRSKAVRRRAANLRQLQRGQRTAHPTRLRPRDLRARLPRAFCGLPRDALRSWCSAQHAPGTFQRPGRRAIDILWPTLWRPYHRQGVFLASQRRGLAAQVAHFRPRQGRPQATDYREAYRLQATVPSQARAILNIPVRPSCSSASHPVHPVKASLSAVQNQGAYRRNSVSSWLLSAMVRANGLSARLLLELPILPGPRGRK